MDEIFNRGTCRYFKELTPVPDEELLTLVKAGMQARAVGNQKSRDFIIVTREDLVKAISHNSIIAGPARKAERFGDQCDLTANDQVVDQLGSIAAAQRPHVRHMGGKACQQRHDPRHSRLTAAAHGAQRTFSGAVYAAADGAVDQLDAPRSGLRSAALYDRGH